jgi:probable rRNA maturation factor
MVAQSGTNVLFFFDGVTPAINNRRKLKKYINSIFLAEKKELKVINYIFTSDNAIHKINKKHLNHDFYTDIITFKLSENNEPIVAEVYISFDRVRENAIQLNTSFSLELHRVMFHGVLHLTGYNDKTKGQKLIMRKKEDHYLSRYFGQRFT